MAHLHSGLPEFPSETRPSKIPGGMIAKILNPEIPKTKSIGAENGLHFQGDIRENKIRNGATNRNGLTLEQKHWPNGVVTYQFASNLPKAKRDSVMAAIEDFETFTCIRFKQRTNEPDYLEIAELQGCNSYMGRQGGRQVVSLGPGCDGKGVALHELMHALGFSHEQSRPDRDQYIEVHLEHVQPEYVFAYDKLGTAEGFSTLGTHYDYSSIMQYEKNAFSKDGQDTMVAKDPKAFIGQRYGLSELDAQRIKTLYKCKNGNMANFEKSKPGFNKFIDFSAADKDGALKKVNAIRSKNGEYPLIGAVETYYFRNTTNELMQDVILNLDVKVGKNLYFNYLMEVEDTNYLMLRRHRCQLPQNILEGILHRQGLTVKCMGDCWDKYYNRLPLNCTELNAFNSNQTMEDCENLFCSKPMDNIPLKCANYSDNEIIAEVQECNKKCISINSCQYRNDCAF